MHSHNEFSIEYFEHHFGDYKMIKTYLFLNTKDAHAKKKTDNFIFKTMKHGKI